VDQECNPSPAARGKFSTTKSRKIALLKVQRYDDWEEMQRVALRWTASPPPPYVRLRRGVAIASTISKGASRIQ